MRITISDSSGTTILNREVADTAALAEFDKYKEIFLSRLYKQFDQGSESKTFDVDRVWSRLRGLAQSFLRPADARPAISGADRRERLRDIEKVLRKARGLVERAIPNDAGDDLFQGWWDEAGNKYISADGSFDPRYMERKFKEVVEGLVDLERAAVRARVCIRPSKRGKRPVLSSDDIWHLAKLYRDSTCSIPGAGDGPFVQFVMEFLIGIGRGDDIEYDSLTESIKEARRWSLNDLIARKWGPSPFD
jgi:hypothetical protein